MKFDQIKQKFKDEWLLIEVTEEKEGSITDGKVLVHSKQKKETSEAMIKFKDKPTYRFYNGDFPKDQVYML